VATANGVAAFITVDDVMERVPGLSASDDLLDLFGGVALGRAPVARLDHGDEMVTGVAISDRLWIRCSSAIRAFSAAAFR
jgi:hypothetical protein